MYATIATVVISIVVIRFLWRRLFLAPIREVRGGYKSDVTLPHSEPIEFYYADISTMSMKVRFCLSAAEVDFKEHLMKLPAAGSFETKMSDYLTINPAGTVPVLVHEGHPVHESSEQLVYIAENLNQSQTILMPKEANERVICKYWLKQTSMYPHELAANMEAGLKRRAGNLIPMLSLPILPVIASKLSWCNILQSFIVQGFASKQVLIFLFSTMGVQTFKFVPMLTKIIKLTRKSLTLHLAELEDFLKSREDSMQFIHGNDITIADIGWSPILERLQMAGWWDELDTEFMFPRVYKYWNNMRTLPAYREAVRPVGIEQNFLDEIEECVKEWKSKYPWYKALFQ